MDEQYFLKNYISSIDAARTYRVTNDYVARLSRQGKLKGLVRDRITYVERDSLRRFFIKQGRTPAEATTVAPVQIRQALDSQYVSSRDAARLYGVTHDYLARLCRQGKLEGTLQDRTWLIARDSLRTFFAGKGRAEPAATVGALPPAPMQRSALVPAPATSAEIPFVRRILVPVAIGFLFIMSGALAHGLVPRADSTAAVARVESPFFSSGLFSRDFWGTLASMFVPKPVSVATAPPAQTEQTYTRLSVAPGSVSSASSTTATYIQNTYPVVERTTLREVVVPGGFVTYDFLNTQVSRLQDTIADHGNGGGITDFSSLTADDIPDLSGTYLPLAGGTLSGLLNAPYASTTMVTATTASSSALIISGLGNTGTECLQITSSGAVSSTGSACGAGGSSFSYPFPSNATSTLLAFNGGLTSASTTLTGNFVFANATGTNATTTNFAVSSLASGRVPFVAAGGALVDSPALTFSGSTLAVTGGVVQSTSGIFRGDDEYHQIVFHNAGNNTDYIEWGDTLANGGGHKFFTGGASPTLRLQIADDGTYIQGNVGIGTTSPYAKLSVVGEAVAAYFTATTTTVSTFPYASTTALSATSICISADCRTAWPTGGSSFSYPFPSNATTTQIAFNGGATFVGATTTALAVTGSTTISSVLNVGGAINANGGITGALTGNVTGDVSGNAGTVTNGVYTTTFNSLFDPRFITQLAGTSSIASIITLGNLSLPYSQLTGTPSIAAYPFPSNATTTLITFSGGLSSASTTLTGPFVFANATGTNATTTNFAITAISSSLLKTNTNGTIVAAVAGVDYAAAGSSFAYPFPSNATSTSIAFNGGLTASSATITYASTTVITVSGTASTTALIVSGLNAASCDVKASTSGVLSCGTDASAAGAGAYPFAGTGNSTSTLTQFNAGLTAFASSTIGNGTLGLTVSGNATTTGIAYFIGNIGIGSSTPLARLTLHANQGDTNRNLIAVASSTSSSVYSTITSASPATNDTGWAGYTMRQTIAAAQLSNTGNSTTRVTFTASAASALTISNAYIGEKAGAGDAYDFATTPVQLTFNGGSSGATISAGQTLTSDPVSFTVTGASDIIVSFYMASNGNTMIEATRTGWVPYYRNANDASTVNATGYTDCSASCAPTAAVQSVSLVEGLVSTNSTNMLFALDNTGLVTLLNLLANNATSTNLFGGRVTGNTAAFGGTASTTIDSAGAIVAPSTLNIAGIITSTATGASVLPYASTTMITAATASTTALIVSGLNAASCDIKADTNGVLSCGTDLTGPAYPFAGTGNSTSTLTQFNAGLTAFASTTIGAGGQTTGLTISGGATTTGQAYFAGNVGIGTTSPFAMLAVQANNGETNTNLFAIGSSTASATTTLFKVDNTGKTTIANTVVVQGTGTSTYAGGIEATTFNLTSASATSTAANGINLTGGCYAVNGTCIGQVAKLTAIRTYTSDQTYTKPSNLAYVVVETWGGGGGASGMTGGFDANTSDGSSAMRIGGDGAAGTASSFGAHLSAAGGGAGTNASTTECIVGAGGSGSSGDVNLAGESGFKRNMMSSDQTSHNRMPQDALAAFAITFAHGASPSTSTRATGEFSNSTYSCGGGAGGYSQKVVQAASISGTEAVTVGVGGGGGGGGGMDGDEGISFAITQGAGGDGTVGASASGTSGGGGGGGGGGDGWDDTSDVAISAGGAAAAASGTTGGAGGGGGAASGNDQNGANIGGEGDGAAASGTTGGGGGGGSGAGATNTDSGNGASAAGMAGGSGGGGADDPDGDGNNGGPAGASNSTGGAGGGGGGAGSSGAGATGSTATGSAGGAGAAGGTGATNSGGGGGGGGAGLSGGALGTGTNGGTNGTAGGTANGGNGGAGGSDSTNDPGGGGGGGGWSGGTGGSGGTTGNGQGGGGGGGGGGAMGVTGGTGGAGGTGASGTGGSNLNGGSGGGGGGGAGTAGISGGHGSNGRSASYGTSGGGGGGGGGGGTIGMSGGGGGGRAYEYENVDAGAGGGGGGGGAAGGSHGAFGGRGGYQSLGGGDCSEDYCGVSSYGGPGGNGGGGGFVVVYEYTYSTPGADLAETYPTTDATLAPGEIVAFDVANDIHVKRASRTDTSPLAGVISTAPGLVLGLNPDNAAGERPVALSGRVPVRVNLTGGAIQVGDRIALSETPGIGRRATQFEPSVGIALEAYNGGSQATVMIFLDLQAGVSINSIAQGLLGLDVGTSTMPVDFVGAMFGALSGRIASTTGAVASTSAAVASSTAQFVDALFGAFVAKLADLGVYISQEFTLIKNLIASQFTVGSAVQPAGITLYDTQTHEPYCVQVQGGELVYLSGECTATSTPLVPEAAASSTEEFDNPFEEDTDADEQATPPQEGLDEQASSSTEVPDQDSIDNATTTPITPESTAEPTPEPEPEPAPAQQPAPEPEPEPEPQAEQPAQEPEPAPEPSV